MKKLLALFIMIGLFLSPVTLMAQTAHKVTLKWTASVTPSVNHYGVFRATVSGGPYTYIGYTTGTSYINGKNPDGSPLVEGTTYYYVVVAYTAVSGQFSVNSNEVQGTIPITVTIAPATNVTATVQ